MGEQIGVKLGVSMGIRSIVRWFDGPTLR
jgi:hypothetical protein